MISVTANFGNLKLFFLYVIKILKIYYSWELTFAVKVMHKQIDLCWKDASAITFCLKLLFSLRRFQNAIIDRINLWHTILKALKNAE